MRIEPVSQKSGPPKPESRASAPAHMFQLYYERLHEIAEGYCQAEHGYRTLQPTAVVHEAYLRLTRDPHFAWKSRAHFLAFAARVMRQVLVDEARHKGFRKRGSGALRVTLNDDALVGLPNEPEVLDLDRALVRLAHQDPKKAEIVEMRFYAGMTIEEVAETLELSIASINREWRMARAWIGRELGSGSREPA